MPEPSVSTQPCWLEDARDCSQVLEPALIEVLGLVQIDVEEVVGGRQSLLTPSERVAVESFGGFDAHLEELRELGSFPSQGKEFESTGAIARSILGGDSHAKGG